MAKAAKPKILYDSDFNLWIEDALVKLRARDIDNLDWENLIEEIETLGKSEKHEVENRSEVLLIHLLKRQYIPAIDYYRVWELTIIEQRKRLARRFKQSPSLRNYFLEVLPEIYADALELIRTEYPHIQFPDDCPFPMDIDFLLLKKFWESPQTP